MTTSIKAILLASLLLPASAWFASANPAPAPLRERISLDDDWRFIKDDPADAAGSLSYSNLQSWIMLTGDDLVTNEPPPKPDGNPGADVSYTQAAFDDSAWRQLNLPHDWAIEGPFEQNLEGSTGKLKFSGPVWYRKHFTVPAADNGKRIFLDIDGAMSYSEIWLNGQFVGGWPYGYSSFELDLTPFIKVGSTNILSIRLDSPRESSRWYPGAGLYRNVWLVKSAPVHVDHWGTFVTTPEVSKTNATVKIQVTVKNQTDTTPFVGLKNEIYELRTDGSRGKLVASGQTSGVQTAANGEVRIDSELAIANPHLWSITTPNRYVVVTYVQENAQPVDRYETPFGIRTLEFNPDLGFLLNGEHVKFNGVCDHHDLGALGSAVNTRALERQLSILKEMGCNAIRTSHNPPAPELLELCDRMGFVVMDEAFDCWANRKRPGDYHLVFWDWHEKDLRAQLHRDRNHPSVVMWSIGNEINEQADRKYFYIATNLADIVHSEDQTRPITAACNHVVAGYNGFQNIVDVFGYNYKPEEYVKFHAANPHKFLFSSESASTVSSRGEYFFPISTNKLEGQQDFQVSSYDVFAPRWATRPDDEFIGQDANTNLAGEFVWTGFDYIGEPTPYDSDKSNLLNYSNPADRAKAEQELKELGKIRVPSRSSYFGIIDLAGFKKDRFYLYQAKWRPDFPMAHILPTWTWPDRVGQVTPVFVYTSGDSAELFLNGKSLGRKTKGQFEYRLRWDDVVYQPGTLKVVAYKNGKKWATDTVKTAGPAAELAMQPDRKVIAADGHDLSYITVTVEDEKDAMAPHAMDMIHFDIEGPGEIVATDNGDPTDLSSFQSHDRKAFNGLALVIVRAKAGQPGMIKITAHADGLEGTTTKVYSK